MSKTLGKLLGKPPKMKKLPAPPSRKDASPQAQEERRRALLAKSGSANIFSGAMGDTSKAPVTTKTLLGQ